MDRLDKLLEKCSISELKMFINKPLLEVINLLYNKDVLLKESYKQCIKNDISRLIFSEMFKMLLLSKMDKNDILKFRRLLNLDYEKEYNINLLIENIAKVSFKENKLMKELWFNYLNIPENIAEKNKSYACIEKINSESDFYELLDYQYMIKQKALTILNRNDVPRALIHMPTGTGKTKTAMHTIIEYYLHTINREGVIIWMAHTKELIEQAVDTFEKTWKHIGKGEVKLLRLYGDLNLDVEDIDNGIIFAGYNKLISQQKNNHSLFNKLCQRCRLLVVDEAHKSVADCTLEVIKEILRQKEGMLSRGLIGLTATPGRSTYNNNENSLLVNFYENRIINIDLNILNKFNNGIYANYNEEVEDDVIRYLQERKILAKVIRMNLEYEGGISADILRDINNNSRNTENDFTNKFISKIGTVANRNIAIINKLCELDKQGYPTIVFACSIDHAKIISNILSIKGVKNRCVFGSTSNDERSRIIQEYKDIRNEMNILINCEVLTTGFDATNTRCVFITRPTKSIVLYSQMLGRGLRGPMMGGNKECLLIDIEDNLQEYSNESMAFNYFNNYWEK